MVNFELNLPKYHCILYVETSPQIETVSKKNVTGEQKINFLPKIIRFAIFLTHKNTNCLHRKISEKSDIF